MLVTVDEESSVLEQLFRSVVKDKNLPMIKLSAQVILFSVAIMVLIHDGKAQDINSSVWLDDFTQLKRELSGKYANLDWAIAARGLDLKGVAERTESNLRQAKNDAEAKGVIESFLDSFGDGHLTIQWPSNPPAATQQISTDTPTKQPALCERLRFRQHKVGWRFAFQDWKAFREITTADSKYFPIGVLKVSPSKTVGIIRIPIFSEYGFPDLCEQSSAVIGLEKDSTCDKACEEKIGKTSADLLTSALAKQIGVLKKSKTDALVVDITGNGGGTNWVEPAARTLTARRLQSPRHQFIRHEHWTKQLEKRLDVIQEEIVQSAQSTRSLLLKAQATLQNAISESRKTCSREMLWENQPADCSLVVSAPTLYPQSVMAYSRPGSLPNRPSSRFLFYSSRYTYQEGVYSGPLMVLVDPGTWSSAEYFAAMLQDNSAATIIGAPTGGAGCGYTNGGIPTVLRNSRATVKIPDCVRLRRDGSNEVEGITPDVLIPWRATDNRYQRVDRITRAVGTYLNRKR